ncbi:MAG: sporulation protein, partial [Lachnospiraceae bacterium]|nr:sporulation protein [Lachnospiraceae bacterium]
MDQNNFGEVISSLFKGMDAMLASKTVVGQPTKVGDTVLV